MDKSEIVKAIAEKAETANKDADAFLNTFIDVVSENL